MYRNVLEPVNCGYLFSELVNPIFIKDGEQVKVSVSVKYLDQRTKATQISQFDLTLKKIVTGRLNSMMKDLHFVYMNEVQVFSYK